MLEGHGIHPPNKLRLALQQFPSSVLLPANNQSISLRHHAMKLLITGLGAIRGSFPISDHHWRLVPSISGDSGTVSLLATASFPSGPHALATSRQGWRELILAPVCQPWVGGGHIASFVMERVDEDSSTFTLRWNGRGPTRFLVLGKQVECPPLESCSSPVAEVLLQAANRTDPESTKQLLASAKWTLRSAEENGQRGVEENGHHPSPPPPLPGLQHVGWEQVLANVEPARSGMRTSLADCRAHAKRHRPPPPPPPPPYPCFNSCSGRGQCIAGHCICPHGFFGWDCGSGSGNGFIYIYDLPSNLGYGRMVDLSRVPQGVGLDERVAFARLELPAPNVVCARATRIYSVGRRTRNRLRPSTKRSSTSSKG